MALSPAPYVQDADIIALMTNTLGEFTHGAGHVVQRKIGKMILPSMRSSVSTEKEASRTSGIQISTPRSNADIVDNFNLLDA